MYDDLLLPTDGSDGTGTVVDHACSLARRYDATVHVLSVADTRNRFESPSSGLAADAWAESERERAEKAVAATVDALADDVETPFRTQGTGEDSSADRWRDWSCPHRLKYRSAVAPVRCGTGPSSRRRVSTSTRWSRSSTERR